MSLIDDQMWEDVIADDPRAIPGSGAIASNRRFGGRTFARNCEAWCRTYQSFRDDRTRLQSNEDGGVRIVRVLPDSAAEAAGLKPDDIALSLDELEFGSPSKTD
jgi:hypothetical protein